jgi:hypothetical protein
MIAQHAAGEPHLTHVGMCPPLITSLQIQRWEAVKKVNLSVTSAKTGAHNAWWSLDSCVRHNDTT